MSRSQIAPVSMDPTVAAVPPNVSSRDTFLKILSILGTGSPTVSTFAEYAFAGIVTILSEITLNLSLFAKLMGLM